MKPLTRAQLPPTIVLDSGGVPGWAIVICDAICGAGVIRAHELDGLTSADLTYLVGAVVRAAVAAESVDVYAEIADLRRAAEEPEEQADGRAA